MKPRLLLVEDDPTTRMFLHTATQALDVEIDLAASMQQALALTCLRNASTKPCLTRQWMKF